MSSGIELRRLPRTTPEEQGVDSMGVLAFLEEAERTIDHLHSFMFVRNGAVVTEAWWYPYAPEHPHVLFSLSKSFTSTGVGFAISEGLLSLDDTVASFFPNDLPKIVSDNLAAMKVRHLLSMSTGNAEDTLTAVISKSELPWVRKFLACRVEHEPGTQFLYNSGATYMLSAIVQLVSGVTLLEYLRPRLFDPLGIVDPTWDSCPAGINTGGWGLNVRTEDIACFGQLYLQDGIWNSTRVLPEGWVETATRYHIANGEFPESDWSQGYGFQFWRSRHGAYRGDGAFGQFVIVLPEQRGVVAITSGVAAMQPILNLVWDHLLPAMTSRALPSNPETNLRLQGATSDLAMSSPSGAAQAELALNISGATYRFEANEHGIESVSVTFDGDERFVEVTDGKGVHRVVIDFGANWAIGMTALRNLGPYPVAATAAWAEANSLSIRLIYYTTPFSIDLTLAFSGDSVDFTYQAKLAFGPPERIQLVGRREA